jgi:hypothetical protein
MLVLEDSDEDILYLAKGVPREWVGSGEQIRIEQAPTRWGKVSFTLVARPSAKSIVGQVELMGSMAPKEVHFKLRLPMQMSLQSVTVNGRPAALGGLHKDTAIITAQNDKKFEVVGRFS